MEPVTFTCTDAKRISQQMRQGEAVPDTEQLAVSKHMARCSACQVDIPIRRLLANDTDDVFDELTSHRQIERAMSEISTGADSCSVNGTLLSTSAKTPLRYVIPLAAVLVMAVAVFAVRHAYLVKKPLSHPDLANAAQTQNDLSPTQLGASDANYEDEHKTPLAPANLPSEKPLKTPEPQQPYLALADGISIELSADAKIEVVQKSHQLVHLQMNAGRIVSVVNPDVPHPSFVIDTPDGAVTVKGTIFSVDLRGDSKVEVLRGVVEIKQNQLVEKIGAGNGYRMHTQRAYSLPAQTRSALDAVASRLMNVDPSRETPSEDDDAVSMLGQRPDINGSLGSRPQRVVHDAAQPQLQSLLNSARTFKRNRDWANALDTYEKIIHYYPHSTESLSAHITAGNLRLKFGNAKGALAHFNIYLAKPEAPLQEEALLGKIKSHRHLNDTQNELQSMQQFAQRFPDSIHLASIKKRIAILELLE
ncbi:MAG: FecR domain-containing protein [Deltaproteobacteria bacterium]|nr:FecR domain-containing protein [Deltaproteobacteria bacterium]